MKNKIKKIVKLPDSNRTGDIITNWYHIYVTEPGFGFEPRGAMVEEMIIGENKRYSVKPLGYIESRNVLFATPSLHNQQNEAKEFFDWIKTLNQTEICNLVHGRELLHG